jgi:hypothetical protein
MIDADYYGVNGLESWLCDMSEIGSLIPDFRPYSEELELLSNPSSDTFELLGGTIGAGIAAGVYMTTFPVVALDGPAPVIDALWFAGFLRTTRAGYEVGSTIGSTLD